MGKQDILNETLLFVNKFRQELGGAPLDRLPKGEPKHSHACPIAVALADMATEPNELVSAGLATVTISGDKLRARAYYPQAVRDFVSLFDHGEYPELVSS